MNFKNWKIFLSIIFILLFSLKVSADTWHTLISSMAASSNSTDNMTPIDMTTFDEILVDVVVVGSCTAVTGNVIPIFLESNISNRAYAALTDPHGDTIAITGAKPFVAKGNYWFWTDLSSVTFTSASTTDVPGLKVTVKGR